MSISTMKTGLLATAALVLVAAAPQDAPTTPTLGNFTLPPSSPTPTPSPTPVGPVIALPTLAPTPPPTPRARPSSRPTPRATPSPRASETPQPAASPTPTVSPTPSPTSSALAPAPAIVAQPTPSPSPSPSATASPAPAPSGRPLAWPVAAALLLTALLAGAALWWKRRRDAGRQAAAKTSKPRPQAQPKRPAATPPAARPGDALSEAPSFWTPSKPARLPEPAAPPAPPPPPTRPQIEIGIDPRRAGLNLLSATAEVELLLRNEGDATATNIAVDVRLVNAQSAQDSDLGALFAAAMGKSAVPPFEIAPGDEQPIRAVATLPRDAIVPLTAAGRPIFVPLITVDVRYDRGDGGRGQSAAAFMIGVVREGSDKLAPFWLDTTARMYDTIAARPHSFSVRS